MINKKYMLLSIYFIHIFTSKKPNWDEYITMKTDCIIYDTNKKNHLKLTAGNISYHYHNDFLFVSLSYTNNNFPSKCHSEGEWIYFLLQSYLSDCE